MLESYLKKVITDFCKYYDKSVKIVSMENEKIPEVTVTGCSEVVKGFRNVVSAVSNKNSTSAEELAIEDQWIEYGFTNAAYLQNYSNMHYILKELNSYLANTVYFTGNKLSPADVLMYLFVYDVMVSLTFQDKEKYLNLSRWFNHMQQDNKLRQGRIPVHFSRTRLYA